MTSNRETAIRSAAADLARLVAYYVSGDDLTADLFGAMRAATVERYRKDEDDALVCELDALAQLHHLRTCLDAEIDATAATIRFEHGASWEQIGRALGVSRQAAQQRYGTYRDNGPSVTCVYGKCADLAGQRFDSASEAEEWMDDHMRTRPHSDRWPNTFRLDYPNGTPGVSYRPAVLIED